MAKSVWYKIPFKSRKDADYEVWIYKEGTPSSVQTLKGAPAVITTDESANEDIFEPIRTQTGTVSIIYEPSDTYPTVDAFMAAILPASNTDSHVALVEIVNGSYVTRWQGFLSSDVYSQRYVSLAQAIDIPVISMLEAMDSVQITTDAVSGMMKILEVIKKVLNQTAATTGFYPCWSFYVPTKNQGGNILNKYIDTTALFEQKEYTNENSTTYIVSGLSCLKILRRICKYMGWTCRELGSTMYFTCVGQADLACYTRPNTVFPNKLDTTWILQEDHLDQETYMMSEALVYTGNSHEMGMAQGAKSVEVVAKVEKILFNLSLPEMPTNNLVYAERVIVDSDRLKSYVSKNNTFDNRLKFTYYLAHRLDNDTTVAETGTINDAYNDCILNPSCDLNTKYPSFVAQQSNPFEYTKYIGAFFAKIAINNSEYKEGLYVVANNKSQNDATGSVFKISSVLQFTFNNGALLLSIKAKTWYTAGGGNVIPFDNSAYFIVKHGNSYWNGIRWTNTRQYITVQFTDGEAHVLMPITSVNTGIVSVEVKGSVNGAYVNAPVTFPYYDLFIEQLSLDFKSPDDETQSDRGENKYFRLLGTNFRDEISVGVDFASSLNNAPSPSLIMEDAETPMTELDYSHDSTPDLHRPEVVLLDRLATYYSLPRRTVKLEVEHPTIQSLPALELEGYDGKTYLPLAESRDWQADESTLTCFEKP